MRLTLAFLLVGSGCAAGRSSYVLLNAQQEVARAAEAGAAKHAPYEFTLASEYLAKAREENGYSEFGQSELLAKSATEWAARALEATTDAEREFGEGFVPEEKKEVIEEKKENTLDAIDLDDL